MTELTSLTPVISGQTLLFVILSGLVFSITASSTIFVLAKTAKVPKRKLIAALVLVGVVGIFSPLLVVGIGMMAASSQARSIQLESLEVHTIDKGLVLVNFTTKEPMVGYLRYKDTLDSMYIPVLPPYPLEPRTEHEIVVDIGPEGADVYFVLNDTVYQSDGGPFELREEKENYEE